MILKGFCILQVFLIQVISAQLSGRDLSSQNVLNNFANLPLAENGRSRRQTGNPPVGLPSNRNLPVNALANGSPLGNGIQLANFPGGNGLLNNLVFNNGLPKSFALSNGMALPNNVPFSRINNVPQNNLLPSINGINHNGLPFSNVPNGLPFNTVPNKLPFNTVPNGFSLSNVPNGLSNINHLPVANKFPYYNVPVENNILNLNNFPTENSLPNMNTVPNSNGFSNVNNLLCGNVLPQINGLPLNNLPNGNIFSPINNRLPIINNFRITEIGIGNGVPESIFPRYNLQDGNILTNANSYQNGNRLTEVSDGLTNIINNGFSSITNTPPVSAQSNNVLVNDKFSSLNHFPYQNGGSDIANVGHSINNMQINTGMPVDSQRFVNNVPFYNSLVVSNNFPAHTAVSRNNGQVNVINNGMPVSNGGYFNDIMFVNDAMPEICLQNNHGHDELSRNDFQFRNIQMPVNNWHYDFVGANMPGNQNLPDGVRMFSNGQNDYQSTLTSNNFNLAQELVKNLQIEGGNMPFLNGLPVAGITETVTVLNSPCIK